MDHWLMVDDTSFMPAIGAFEIWRAQLNADSFSGNSERNGATHWTKTNGDTPAAMDRASIDSTNAWAETARRSPPTTKIAAIAQARFPGPNESAHRETAGRSSISSTSPSRGGSFRRTPR